MHQINLPLIFMLYAGHTAGLYYPPEESIADVEHEVDPPNDNELNNAGDRQRAQLTTCQTLNGEFIISKQCFKLNLTRMNWSNARSYCKGIGLDLAQPEDPWAVYQYMKNKSWTSTRTWIGAQGNGSCYQWLNGTCIPNNSPLWVWGPDGGYRTSYTIDIYNYAHNGKPLDADPMTATHQVLCQRYIAPWPYVGDGCCDLSTTPKCKAAGGGCIPRNETCVGDEYVGEDYCDFNHLKSCKCCVPPNYEALPPCQLLNGTCNVTCTGRSVSGKEFCKDSKHCKCCLPEKKVCPCGQDYNGGCTGQFSSGISSTGQCMKDCPPGTIPLNNSTCSSTGGNDCKCCAKDCQSPWTTVGDGCYYFKKLKCPWSNAKGYCMRQKGYLAIINTEAERISVVDYMKASLSSYNTTRWWLGGSNLSGPWLYVDNSTVTEGWNVDFGEPDAGTSACMYTSMQYVKPGKNDLLFDFSDCTTSYDFICEK